VSVCVQCSKHTYHSMCVYVCVCVSDASQSVDWFRVCGPAAPSASRQQANSHTRGTQTCRVRLESQPCARLASSRHEHACLRTSLLRQHQERQGSSTTLIIITAVLLSAVATDSIVFVVFFCVSTITREPLHSV